MKIRVYYYLIADENEDGMPVDGPFNTKQEAIDFAAKEYGFIVNEVIVRDES